MSTAGTVSTGDDRERSSSNKLIKYLGCAANHVFSTFYPMRPTLNSVVLICFGQCPSCVDDSKCFSCDAPFPKAAHYCAECLIFRAFRGSACWVAPGEVDPAQPLYEFNCARELQYAIETPVGSEETELAHEFKVRGNPENEKAESAEDAGPLSTTENEAEGETVDFTEWMKQQRTLSQRKSDQDSFWIF
jgi:hypothetical protein